MSSSFRRAARANSGEASCFAVLRGGDIEIGGERTSASCDRPTDAPSCATPRDADTRDAARCC
jgi:hypothetical protein